MSGYATSHASVIEIDDEREAFDLFDAVCHRQLAMSGREFLKRHDAGEFEGRDSDEITGLPEVLAALSFIR